MKSRKAMHFHTKRNKKISISLMLASLLLAGFASTRAVFAEETSSSTFPEVGTEWVHVKLPLRTGYYSTAESQHKKLASSKYKVENLSDYPVAVSLSGFVGGDDTSSPVTTGIEGLNMNLDTTSVPLVTKGQAEAFNTSDKNVALYTLGSGSTTPAPGSFNGKSSGQFNFSGTTQAAYDTTKATVLENQLSFTLVGLDGDGNVPEDQTSINVHDSTLKVGDQWSAEDNFDGGTDEFGQALTFDKVTVTGDTVDTATPGSYEVTYTYRNVSKTATVTVKAGAVPPVLETDNTVDFMNEKWDVIKGPDQLGSGNYLISMQHGIEKVTFKSSFPVELSTFYYHENESTADGYKSSVPNIHLGTWYKENVKGTDYEAFVQPVILSNPTLGDMKVLGWESNTVGGSTNSFLAINQPGAYPTKVDNKLGSKQAFAMSGSDVSDGKGGYSSLTKNALVHTERLKENGVVGSWLRSPGLSVYEAAAIGYSSNAVGSASVKHVLSEVPALVIKIDGDIPQDQTAVTVHDSTLKVGDQWSAEDNFDGGTDELGQALTFDKVTVAGDTVDTTTPGSYEVTYTYRNVSKMATVTVKAVEVPPVLETEGTVDFMNEKWDVIKGPDQLGAGNYLIALQHEIDRSKYNDGTLYFVENKDTADGYNHSGNYVKKKIDDWYTNEVSNTSYEKYVQPVVLSNPTLGAMKNLGWKSNTDSSTVKESAFITVNHPTIFHTKVDAKEGKKQAFAMSGSDIKEINTTTTKSELTKSAVKHGLTLIKNGTEMFWLRSPGKHYNNAGSVNAIVLNSQAPVSSVCSVVPSLIIHID